MGSFGQTSFKETISCKCTFKGITDISDIVNFMDILTILRYFDLISVTVAVSSYNGQAPYSVDQFQGSVEVIQIA
jgi:hypothetical protein